MLSCQSSVELKKKHSRSYSDVAARFADSKSHTWNNNILNRHRTGTPHQCHEVQGFHHSKDERPMSQASTRQAAPNVPTRPSPPSQQLGQRSSCPIGVQSLLNPLKVEHHVNAGSAPGTISEKTTSTDLATTN